MLVVYYAGCQELGKEAFESHLQEVPVHIKEKILKFRKWEDRKASLLGKLLLAEALRAFKGSDMTLQDIQYTAYQRPYIAADVDFNISHAEDWVVCAFGYGMRLGIDIEKRSPIDLKDFKSQFSLKEWNTIEHAADPYGAFYGLWTKKEAIAKAEGKGLQLPFRDINIKNNKAFVNATPWFITELPLIPGYEASLAANVEHAHIDVRACKWV